MSTLKTKIDSQLVIRFLKNNFNKDISNLTFVKSGETSQAFFFDVHQKQYVIRVNTNIYSFEKDRYAFEHFAPNAIPIPEITQVGTMGNNYCFAISKRAKGDILDNFDEKTNYKLLPNLITVLENIHHVDISNQDKFGTWDREGKAKFSTWKEFILSINRNDYHNWEEIYRTTVFERDIFNTIYKKILELTEYIPEERQLVHGDYGFNNVLSDGKKITGVVDWGESMYGDFIYDVAWLNFWSSTIQYGEIFHQYYRSHSIPIPNYLQRLLCYELHLSLGALNFYAKSNQRKSYIETRSKILSILK